MFWLPMMDENSILEMTSPQAKKSTWKRILAFCGPGYMIAVGYLDPGNWATDIEAGSRFGYKLLTVIMLSNLMAMLLQHLCIRMGVVLHMDLAEASRCHFPRWLNYTLYVICEIAIIAMDLAEVIGTAIALKLLFNIPIIVGVLITGFDVLILLAGLDTKNFRMFEFVVVLFVSIIGFCFVLEMIFVKPSLMGVLDGLIPRPSILSNPKSLELALGIIGATVMPHNLYLHSSIVKHRNQLESKKMNVRFATFDSSVALFFAMFVNGAILVTSAAAFHAIGKTEVTSIEDASELLQELLGPASRIIFGLALLAAGQSSTMTGTVAGQIVFEGFLDLKIRPWARRLITRMFAIVPAVLIIALSGGDSTDTTNRLLIQSQIVLSFQLPFAIIPLVYFTSSKKYMHEFANPWPMTIAASLISLLMIGLNVTLLFQYFFLE